MKKAITRKDFLQRTGILAAISIPGIAAAGSLLSQKEPLPEKTRTWPWPYATLNVENVRIAGHDSYWTGKGCSYAAFHAIINELRQVVGSPFTDMPTEIMIFGHGGAAGWGTLCGALTGAAAAIQLVCTKADADILISELIGLYTQMDFPTTISNTYAQNHTFGHTTHDMVLAQSQSNSPLCHVSATKWVDVGGFAIGSSERKERCARLSGDVAAKAVELLNAHYGGTFVSAYTPPAEVAYCLSCHGSNTLKSDVATKSHCLNCHTDHTSSVPEQQIPVLMIGHNAPNPFSTATILTFTLAKANDVSLNVYDMNGRLVKRLLENQHYPQGEHKVSWDGRNEQGSEEKAGMYIFRCHAGKTVVTRPVIKI